MFWEDEQFSGLVREVLTFWSTEPEMTPEASSPRFLLNLLDLVTRLAGANNVEAIIRAATSPLERDNEMIARMMGAVEVFPHDHHDHGDFDELMDDEFDDDLFGEEEDEEEEGDEEEDEEEDEEDGEEIDANAD